MIFAMFCTFELFLIFEIDKGRLIDTLNDNTLKLIKDYGQIGGDVEHFSNFAFTFSNNFKSC